MVVVLAGTKNNNNKNKKYVLWNVGIMQTYKYQYANDTSRPRVHVLGLAMLRSDIFSGY